MTATISSEYIKCMKKELKAINKALRVISKSEQRQEVAQSDIDYEKACRAAKTANANIMAALDVAVRTASTMGSLAGNWDLYQGHRIEEYSLKK